MSDIFDRLKEVKKKFDRLNEKLIDVEVLKDKQKLKEINKELKNLEPFIDCYEKYEKFSSELREAEDILKDSSLDKEFKNMAKEQYEESENNIEKLAEKVKILMLPKDPNDEKNVIIEIRGGAGGEEAALFSSSLYRMYSMYSEKKGFKTEVLNLNETGIGGLKEISFEVNRSSRQNSHFNSYRCRFATSGWGWI